MDSNTKEKLIPAYKEPKKTNNLSIKLFFVLYMSTFERLLEM